MSKRGADEYITKEHGSTPNAAEEAAKVKMATAAQMAKRKMAVPKSRAGRTGQSPLPGAGPSNPFTSTNLFGAPQNNQQAAAPSSSGFSFGASQSFPPGDSTSNTAFAFSVPGQSSSFTFGQPAPNNPFANLNGSAGTQSAQTPDSNDITMESPQKKPALGSNMFGAGSTESSTPSAGFSFGQTTSQPPSQSTFAFGQTTQGFGNTSTSSLFGQSTSKPPELFGQSTQTSSSAADSSGIFGQKTSTIDPPTTSGSPGFGFGQPATTGPPSASGFSFGQPATSTPAIAPTFSFGLPSTQSKPNGTLFGESQQNTQATIEPSTPAVAPPLFGSSSTNNTGKVFGGFGTPKPIDAEKSPEPTIQSESSKQSLFGQTIAKSSDNESKSDPGTQDPAKINPFAGLFGKSSPQKTDFSSSSSAETPKPLFNFAAPAQPSGLFSIPKPAATDSIPKPADETTKKSLFQLGTPSATSSSTMFSPVKSSATPMTTNPFAGLSANKTPSTEAKTDQPLFGFAKGDTKEISDKSESGFKLLPSSKPNTTSNASTSESFGGFGKATDPSTLGASKQSTQEQSFQTSATSQPTFGQAMPSPAQADSKPDSSSTPTQAPHISSGLTADTALEGPKRNVNTHPPTRIPPYLNGEEYKSYDSNYRLHSLNREFQKRIASLDPSREDFGNILRHYVAARESIGESIGLYTRNIAGMKRKADDEDDRHGDDSSSTKRSKPAGESPAKGLFGNAQTSSSVFQPVPSSPAKQSTTSANTASQQNATPAASSTSSLFSSMIPNKSTPSTSASSNPFANLPKANAPAPSDTSFKPAFSFGASANTSVPAGSTTPTKSPPKKPAFDLPKFAAPSAGTNFMDAFKKQSEANAAKFAKEEKAKRKAEDFDSDEDDEEEWNRKYDEEEKAKKAKLDLVAQKGFMPSFGNSTTSSAKPAFNFGTPTATAAASVKPSTGFVSGGNGVGTSSDKPIDISENDASGEDEEDEDSGDSGNAENEVDEEDEGDEDDLPEDDVDGDEDEDDNDEDEDFETALAKSRGQGKSLFDRVTPNPTKQKSSSSASAPVQSVEKDTTSKPSVFGNVFGKGTPEAPAFSPLTPTGTKEPYKPSATFSFTSAPAVTSPTPVQGASIFAGGIMKDGPVIGEGLFGSRPSTPSNADKSKPSVFGNLGTPSATPGNDHTWKKGSEIKFGSSNAEAPSFSITEPSPQKGESKPFAGLFGATSSSANNSSAPSLGFNFGQNPAPGFLAATSHLVGGSGTTSGISSRATSPGTTDNESVATNEEDYSNDTQVSLMEVRPGEENENVIFETRARALRWYTEEQIQGTKFTKGWNVAGLGMARLLKHRESGKTRLVMRAEPGANIILNTNLQPEMKYEYVPAGNAGTVKFNVFTNEGPQGWTLKVKTAQQGQEMAKVMEENKNPST